MWFCGWGRGPRAQRRRGLRGLLDFIRVLRESSWSLGFCQYLQLKPEAGGLRPVLLAEAWGPGGPPSQTSPPLCPHRYSGLCLSQVLHLTFGLSCPCRGLCTDVPLWPAQQLPFSCLRVTEGAPGVLEPLDPTEEGVLGLLEVYVPAVCVGPPCKSPSRILTQEWGARSLCFHFPLN